MKIFQLSLLLLVIICSPTMVAGSEFEIGLENATLVDVSGAKGLLMVAEFEVDEAVPVGFCSMKIRLEIEGEMDPELQSYFLSCVPWSEEFSESENLGRSRGSYWVRGPGEFSVDVSSCIQISGTHATLRCLLGDFTSGSQISYIGLDSSKSIGSPAAKVSFSSAGPFPKGSYFYKTQRAERKDTVSLKPDLPGNNKCYLKSAPNPFNPQTTIFFDFGINAVKGDVGIYNVRGHRVFHIPVEFMGKGSISWNGQDTKGSPVASGVYFVLLSSENGEKLAKLPITLLK